MKSLLFFSLFGLLLSPIVFAAPTVEGYGSDYTYSGVQKTCDEGDFGIATRNAEFQAHEAAVADCTSKYELQHAILNGNYQDQQVAQANPAPYGYTCRAYATATFTCAP